MSSLTKQELVDVFALHLRDAEDELMYADGTDGAPDTSKPQRAHIYGPGTKQFARADTERNNKNMERLQRKGKIKKTTDETLKEKADFAIAVTKSLENIDSDNGKAGEDLFAEVYFNPKLSHITEQVELNARNTANFMPGSTKT